MDDFALELRKIFLEEAAERLAACEAHFLALEGAGDITGIDEILRLAHSLKGSAATAGLDALAAFTHELETLLILCKREPQRLGRATVDTLLSCNDALRAYVEAAQRGDERAVDFAPLSAELLALQSATPVAASAASQDFEIFDETPAPPAKVAAKATVKAAAPPKAAEDTIRVKLPRIDRLMNDIGELVILQAALEEAALGIDAPALHRVIAQIAKTVNEAQRSSMSLRMVPLKSCFQKMQRVARDTSDAVGKSVELRIAGEDTEIDKTLLEGLDDPLVHIIRNAIDHGLESSEARLAAGKTERGVVRLAAFHRGGDIVIEVSDDGRGLDAERIRAKAVENGLIRATDRLTEGEAWELIFAPGFSTKSEVTGVSGRGVGMDVVKTNVTALGGRIEIDSQPGRGSTFRLVLPLTLGVIDGLLVRDGGVDYVLPLGQVLETLRPEAARRVELAQGEGLDLRGNVIPLLAFAKTLGREGTRKTDGGVAVIVSGPAGRPAAVIVDEVVSRQQIVIKRLGEDLRGTVGLSGATVLSNGRAALIIDVAELVRERLEAA